MKVLVITGGIGSGKSEVCRIISQMGYRAQYNADERVKSLYISHPSLLNDIEKALGLCLRGSEGEFLPKLLSERIFTNPQDLQKVEDLVFPILIEDFSRFEDEHKNEKLIIFESATILDKPAFNNFGDWTLYVDAPFELRLERACRRDGSSRDMVMDRMKNQKYYDRYIDDRIDAVIMNDAGIEELKIRTLEAVNALFKKNNYEN